MEDDGDIEVVSGNLNAEAGGHLAEESYDVKEPEGGSGAQDVGNPVSSSTMREWWAQSPS